MLLYHLVQSKSYRLYDRCYPFSSFGQYIPKLAYLPRIFSVIVGGLEELSRYLNSSPVFGNNSVFVLTHPKIFRTMLCLYNDLARYFALIANLNIWRVC